MGTLRDFAAAAVSGLRLHIRRYGSVWSASLLLLLVLAGGSYALIAPPADFPAGSIYVIKEGTTGIAAARGLEAAHLIRHPAFLRAVLRIEGRNVHAGAYRFAAPQDELSVALRLANGLFGIPPIHLTVVEGATVRDMAAKIAAAFPEISSADFISAAQPYEGYLFPDTYIFQPDATADTIVSAMRANFDAKIAVLESDITASGHSLSDIVTMASIIEKEADTPVDRRIIAGILWRRIALGMPLQVDAVFGYINNRATYSPSFADLAVDSPYNTYKYKGLPPGPIASPGLDSIEAALHPTKTNYLYYLTGKDGLMHYAATYAGQLANERKYLQ